MSKVITFSRTFPAHHPKAGKSTNFDIQFLNWYWLIKKDYNFHSVQSMLEELNPNNFTEDQIADFYNKLDLDSETYKYHTIRAGNRWKAGDMFSPRVWSGKPYNSPQITIAPDIRVEKVWDVEVDEDLCLWIIGGDESDPDILEKVAHNDGLELQDLLSWFNKPMIGQLICWDKDIEY